MDADEHGGEAAPPAPNSVSSTLSQIAKFIPGDVLTLYIAALGTIHGSGGADFPYDRSLWSAIVFFTCLVLTPVWVFAVRYLSAKSDEVFVWPIWPTIAAVLSFLVYASSCASLAQSGFAALSIPGGLSALLLIFSAPILALLNEVVGRRFPNQKALISDESCLRRCDRSCYRYCLLVRVDDLDFG